MKPYGQVLYEAYCEHAGWIGYNGDSLPDWNDVDEDIRAHWEYAAVVLAGEFYEEFQTQA